ncbi:cytochrome c [Luteolibacter sp. Populi]|uniref:c-type cytochrome n=1 Tax=Luteolibacter sp. Populi TaxID=3230487 RepID=UPI0034661A80
MKYFFIAYAIIAALVIGLLPTRGSKSPNAPFRLFPDMDDQDKLKPQKPDGFFADGQGGRLPVHGTQALGFNPEGAAVIGGIPELEFGGGTGYYATGGIDGYYGNGMPEEIKLTDENVGAFLRRGEESFSINCAVCHGKSGDGQGITGQFGVPGIANLTDDTKKHAVYPDGRMFEVITNGKGQMGAYKHNIPLRDRWAIIAYVRSMQYARKAPYDAVKEAYDKGIAEQQAAATK